MNISFEIVNDNTAAVKAELKAALFRGAEAVGLQAEGHAKAELSNTPKRIDTGLLRNSITHAVSGGAPAAKSAHASYGANRNSKGKRLSAGSKNAGSVGIVFNPGTAPEAPPGEVTVYVGTNVSYAGYVHDGTTKMQPNPFLRNGLSRNTQEYAAIFKQALSQ